MPKRKAENSLDYIVKKFKRLEEEVKRNRHRSRRRHRRISSSSSGDTTSTRSGSSSSKPSQREEMEKPCDGTFTEYGEQQQWESVKDGPSQSPLQTTSSPVTAVQPDALLPETTQTTASPQPSTSRTAATVGSESQQQTETTAAAGNSDLPGLDPNILNILGVDPNAIVEYGPSINAELANRLTYVLTSGLKKEERKEFSKKYLVPENCQSIAAPIMNAEIKAALHEAHVKRDKGLESRQNSVATAISCLSKVITTHINSTEPDHELLQQIVDATRILCDVHHNVSTTRKLLAVANLKKEVKEQLSNTKIGKHLFGDNLSDTLKNAKAVSKSGAELKEQVKKQNDFISKNLNWKTTSGTRRQAPTQSSSRRQPAPHAPPPAASTSQHRYQPPPPPPPRQHGTSSSASSHRPRQSRRR